MRFGPVIGGCDPCAPLGHAGRVTSTRWAGAALVAAAALCTAACSGASAGPARTSPAAASAPPSASAQAPAPSASPSATPGFTLVATGDLLIHGPVAKRALSNGHGKRYDFTPMLTKVRQ